MGYFSLSKMFSSRKKKRKFHFFSSGHQGEHCPWSLNTNEEELVTRSTVWRQQRGAEGTVKTSAVGGCRKQNKKNLFALLQRCLISWRM